MVDKNFCMSSYIAYRYVYKEGMDFFPDMIHKNYDVKSAEEKVYVKNAKEIDAQIQKSIDEIYKKYSNVGILLSGGMDSAILAAYLKEESHAYTFTSNESDVYKLDVDRAKKYCDKFNLTHHLVDISLQDYETYTPIVMKRKCAPVHSIEPQIYKAALAAKKDGVEIMIIGDAADYIFGGMDKLLSEDWSYNGFINRYKTLDPQKVLSRPVDVDEIFEPYRIGADGINFQAFLKGPTVIESYGSYENPFACAGMLYFDPYEDLEMAEPLDLNRIRNGESKYLIRELFSVKYPEIEVPEKIPMPRIVDKIFRNWDGPKREEFRQDIAMGELSGNQKWQLWCLEKFLNLYE